MWCLLQLHPNLFPETGCLTAPHQFCSASSWGSSAVGLPGTDLQAHCHRGLGVFLNMGLLACLQALQRQCHLPKPQIGFLVVAEYHHTEVAIYSLLGYNLHISSG